MSDDGVSIYGECGDFAFKPGQWKTVLALASGFGWEPTGTQPPDEIASDKWDGRYMSSDAQEISQDDALALAAALSRALDDIPDALVRRLATVGIHGNVLELFADDKRLLRWFIAHCRECAPFLIC